MDNRNASSVAVVGLGIIGSIWAGHYQSSGRLEASWNRTPKPDAPGFQADLTKACSGAGVIHICVADPAAVGETLAQILPTLTEGSLVIQSSTIGPQASASFEQQVCATGAAYVEAPFTGSSPAARNRELVFYTGGSPSSLDRAGEVLAALSKQVFRFDSGAKAAALKLAMNLQIAAISTALTEGWHLAKLYGLTDDEFFEALRPNVAHSGLAKLKEPMLRNRETAPMFSVKHMKKDLGLALAAARDLHLSQAERTWEIYARGIEAGLGNLDFIALEQLIDAT